MILAPLPLNCDDDVIVDWFEIYVLSSRYGSASLSDLGRIWDTRRNTEDSTFDEQTDDSIAGTDGDQNFVERISSAIRSRMEILSGAYPFKFSASGASLEYLKGRTVGKRIYLFCLLLSVNNDDEIFDLSKYKYKLTNEVRDLFQACSTWAAAAHVQGSAISFGFPRPDGSSFINALNRVYAHFGEGRAVKVPKPGVSSKPKDEGIDVVAWGHRPDKGAGVPYLLGQVATGRNWKDKTVTSCVAPFHANWFEDPPASQPTTAMFIPHCLVCTNATLQEQIIIETREFGTVFYRFHLPLMAEEGVKHAKRMKKSKKKKFVKVERLTDFAAIDGWVKKIITGMSASAY